MSNTIQAQNEEIWVNQLSFLFFNFKLVELDTSSKWNVYYPGFIDMHVRTSGGGLTMGMELNPNKNMGQVFA